MCNASSWQYFRQSSFGVNGLSSRLRMRLEINNIMSLDAWNSWFDFWFDRSPLRWISQARDATSKYNKRAYVIISVIILFYFDSIYNCNLFTKYFTYILYIFYVIIFYYLLYILYYIHLLNPFLYYSWFLHFSNFKFLQRAGWFTIKITISEYSISYIFNVLDSLVFADPGRVLCTLYILFPRSLFLRASRFQLIVWFQRVLFALSPAGPRFIITAKCYQTSTNE